MDEILKFLTEMEAVKREMRHVWLSDGRQESTAEHTWRMALMAILLGPKLEHPVDVDRTIRIILSHDVSEAYVGDIPAFEYEKRAAHKQVEAQAMRKKKQEFSDDAIQNVFSLYEEYDAQETPEAKFAKALDRIEVWVQKLHEDPSKWTVEEWAHTFYGNDIFCQHDSFLREISSHLKKRFKKKFEKTGKDMKEIERLEPFVRKQYEN